MIRLLPTDLHWLNRTDNPGDICAHGSVELEINGVAIETDDDTKSGWTVSAAALHLLRTLTSNHDETTRVCDNLLPCCGHHLHAVEGEEDVVNVECPNGFDWSVVHADNQVRLIFSEDSEFQIPLAEWKRAVCEFSDAVEQFYVQSKPKEPSDDYAKAGYERFRSEWKRRRTAAG